MRRIGRADRGIGVGVDRAIGMQLVADQALGAQRHHLRGLELERIGMLEAAELAPAGVELAGMGDEIEAERRRIARARGEMVVAPAAGRQAFELEVAVGREALRPLLMDVAAIVEDAQPGELGAQALRSSRAETLVDPARPSSADRRRSRDRAPASAMVSRHAAQTQSGVRMMSKKMPWRLVARRHLARLGEQLVAIGRDG